MLNKRTTEVYALGKHISMSAHKARRVIDQICGRSYEETLMILELMPYQSCYPIFKLVYSAAAIPSSNTGSNEANLVISKAAINKGTIMKRLKPCARGRSFSIQKPTCHITIIMKDISIYEYIDTDSITWSQNKKKIQLCRIMICIAMGEHGTKNKSNWFQIWYNLRSSFPLVRTTKKLFPGSARR